MSELGPATDVIHTLSTAESKFARTLQQLREQLDDLQGHTRHKARAMARSTDGALHHHPYGAVGIALAAGLVLGFLVSRR